MCMGCRGSEVAPSGVVAGQGEHHPEAGLRGRLAELRHCRVPRVRHVLPCPGAVALVTSVHGARAAARRVRPREALGLANGHPAAAFLLDVAPERRPGALAFAGLAFVGGPRREDLLPLRPPGSDGPPVRRVQALLARAVLPGADAAVSGLLGEAVRPAEALLHLALPLVLDLDRALRVTDVDGRPRRAVRVHAQAPAEVRPERGADLRCRRFVGVRDVVDMAGGVVAHEGLLVGPGDADLLPLVPPRCGHADLRLGLALREPLLAEGPEADAVRAEVVPRPGLVRELEGGELGQVEQGGVRHLLRGGGAFGTPRLRRRPRRVRLRRHRCEIRWRRGGLCVSRPAPEKGRAP
mmetsp:Transcript_18865/g.41523  ORF Transcript_18865/g.41523 Transcript_18865/m.41523 type:complete len:352 (+) Transcript_18865:220-1275(+)